jgi:hypothetical protein
MGKAGEKQKRKPKISDKKQSERFKEIARVVGANRQYHRDHRRGAFARLARRGAVRAGTRGRSYVGLI